MHIRWHRSAWWFRKNGCQSISTTSWALGWRRQRLVPNLRNKDRYVLHYRNLQLYTSLGMRLTKVHRTLRFDQSPWVEPYIRMNTELRKKAASDFEKDLYKLMNNSVFGKTMKNLRKRVDVKLVRSNEEDKLRRLIASPAFARASIFDDHLAAIQIHKTNLVLNRPVYVGMSILDLSKHLMYNFYYNQLKAQYGESCQLVYTDTDSLLLEMETEDVYKNMAQNQTLYDTSDYPQDHPLYSSTNKKVLGKLKDECVGRAIAEYVGLRPKMYSILEAGGKNTKKAKGVKKECREEAHQARAVQRGPLRKANLPPWHGFLAVRAPSYLRATSEQGISHLLILSAGSQKMGWTRWHMDTGMRSSRDVAGWIEVVVERLRTPSGGSCVSDGTANSSSRTKPRCGVSSPCR